MKYKFIIVTALMALWLCGCVGQTAREKYLPTVNEVWQSVKTEAIGDTAVMDEAVSTGAGLSTAWQAVRPLVVAGIELQGYDEHYKSSRMELVTRLDEITLEYGD